MKVDFVFLLKIVSLPHHGLMKSLSKMWQVLTFIILFFQHLFPWLFLLKFLIQWLKDLLQANGSITGSPLFDSYMPHFISCNFLFLIVFLIVNSKCAFIKRHESIVLSLNLVQFSLHKLLLELLQTDCRLLGVHFVLGPLPKILASEAFLYRILESEGREDEIRDIIAASDEFIHINFVTTLESDLLGGLANIWRIEVDEGVFLNFASCLH